MLKCHHDLSELYGKAQALAEIDVTQYAAAVSRESHGCYSNFANASDLIRWLGIYLYGGIYLDVDLRVKCAFGKMFSASGLRLNLLTYENGYFGAVARHPMFLKIINTCVSRYRHGSTEGIAEPAFLSSGEDLSWVVKRARKLECAPRVCDWAAGFTAYHSFIQGEYAVDFLDYFSKYQYFEKPPENRLFTEYQWCLPPKTTFNSEYP